MFGWIKRLLVGRKANEDKVVESSEDKICRLVNQGQTYWGLNKKQINDMRLNISTT